MGQLNETSTVVFQNNAAPFPKIHIQLSRKLYKYKEVNHESLVFLCVHMFLFALSANHSAEVGYGKFHETERCI